MNRKFIYNTKTHTLHIEGFCPYAKIPAACLDHILCFNSETDVLAYDGRAVGWCKRCERKREQDIMKVGIN